MEPSNENKKYKLVGFEDILKLTNAGNKKKGEAAITILTPKQIIHAIPRDGYTDSHGILVGEIYKDIFGLTDENPVGIAYEDMSKFCLEIRHCIYSANHSIAIVNPPKVITPDEFTNMKKYIDILMSHGREVYSLISDFDPRILSLKDRAKRVAEPEGEDIINYFMVEGRIVDYELPFEENILLSQKEKVNNI